MQTGKRGITEFIDIYLDYYTVVFGTIYSWLGNREDAEDICHEVFLRFYEKQEGLEDINIRSWLLVTAKNIMLNFINKKKPVNVPEIKDLADLSFNYVNGFKDTRIIIEEALDKITTSDIEKNLIDLIAINNFTYNEAASLLGLTRRQVEYKYTQIVRKFIDYLQTKGIKSIEELL